MLIDSFGVIKTEDNFHFLEWSATPEGVEALDEWEVVFQFSIDPVSKFQDVTDFTGDQIIIQADTATTHKHDRRHYDFNKDYYYKMTIREIANPGNSVTSSTVWICMSFDGVHDVMRYNETVLYDIYHGEPCKIIKKKNFGTRCPDCWSVNRLQRTRTHCDTCKGTGFLDGWYDPIEIQISFDSDPKKTDSQKDFENVYDTKRARLSNYPLVKPKDIILNLDKAKRYTIEHVETTKLPNLATENDPGPPNVNMSKANYIVSQLLTLQEIVTDDNEYFIEEDYYDFHEPVTTTDPMEVDSTQLLTIKVSGDDFDTSNDELALKNSIQNFAVNSMVAGEDILTLGLVLVVNPNEDGSVLIADSSDSSQANNVIGINITTASGPIPDPEHPEFGDPITETIEVQNYGRIVNGAWSWTLGDPIYFDSSGVLTQTKPTTSGHYAMSVAKAISPTEIEVFLEVPEVIP